jgi:hypothetical protein
MATKIRMVSDWKTRKTGEVWSASDSQAKQLIDAEIAVAFVEEPSTENTELTTQTDATNSEPTVASVTTEASATSLAPEVAAPTTPTEEVADAPTQTGAAVPHRFNRRCHTK